MSAAGLSKSRLSRLHDTMNGHVARGELPGLVALVCRRGEVHVAAIGNHAVGGSKPMQRDTLFRIASMTKPITAAATMILIEEGKLRLDDPVDRFLPELANRRVLARIDASIDETVPARRPITARDLLTFRFGMGLVLAPPGKYPIQKAITDAGLMPGPDPSSLTPDAWMKNLGALAVGEPTRRTVGLPHRLRRARRAGRAHCGSTVPNIPARAHLFAARHEGHRLSRSRR
jgi:Beta-lactamase